MLTVAFTVVGFVKGRLEGFEVGYGCVALFEGGFEALEFGKLCLELIDNCKRRLIGSHVSG